jgi:hypothetical protein
MKTVRDEAGAHDDNLHSYINAKLLLHRDTTEMFDAMRVFTNLSFCLLSQEDAELSTLKD